MSSPCHNCCHLVVSNLHFLFLVFCAQSIIAIFPPPSVVRAFGLPKLHLFYGNTPACAVSKGSAPLLLGLQVRHRSILTCYSAHSNGHNDRFLLAVIWAFRDGGLFSSCIVRTKELASLALQRWGGVEVENIYHHAERATLKIKPRLSKVEQRAGGKVGSCRCHLSV